MFVVSDGKSERLSLKVPKALITKFVTEEGESEEYLYSNIKGMVKIYDEDFYLIHWTGFEGKVINVPEF